MRFHPKEGSLEIFKKGQKEGAWKFSILRRGPWSKRNRVNLKTVADTLFYLLPRVKYKKTT